MAASHHGAAKLAHSRSGQLTHSLFKNQYPLVYWLLSEARQIAEPKAFLAALANRLTEIGLDPARMTTGVPILHPQVHSYSAVWEAPKEVTDRFFRITAASLQALDNSPVKIVYSGGGSVRCDPKAPALEGEFSILADLRKDGMTDYVALSIPFSDGSTKLVTVATKRPGGFSDAEIAMLEEATPAIAVNLEVQTLRLTARTLLETYVGKKAGVRVLDGAIKRGMGETIRAVIWMSDLRGFTSLSEQMPSEDLLTLLNEYFGGICGAIDECGGEVLKFIGDAVLGIFPIAENEDQSIACERAIAAAQKAQARLGSVNTERTKEGAPKIDYGIALHVGDVVYGNIGSENRLDFTVIGPAVNLVARIEGLCGDLGRPLLLSADFARASGLRSAHVGAFDLKGIALRQEVFAPADDS